MKSALGLHASALDEGGITETRRQQSAPTLACYIFVLSELSFDWPELDWMSNPVSSVDSLLFLRSFVK